MTEQKLGEVLQAALRASNTPGGAVAIYSVGKEIEASAGVASILSKSPMTTRTIFPLASLSKPFTAALAMRYSDLGAFHLDTPWSECVPGQPYRHLVPAGSSPTITALLEHRAGLCDRPQASDIPELAYWRMTGTVDSYLRSLDDRAVLPGAVGRVSYSTLGFIVLGAVIEEAAATNWEKAIAAEIIGPLGLEDTGAEVADQVGRDVAAGYMVTSEGDLHPAGLYSTRAFAPGMGLFSSVRDMARFGRIFFDDGGAGAGARILSYACVRAAQNTDIELESCWRPGVSQSAGWLIGTSAQKRWLWHPGVGGGFESLIVIDPENEFCLAAVANSSRGYFVMDKLLQFTLREFFGVRVPTFSGRRNAARSDEVEASYAGTYRNGQRLFEIEHDQRGLSLRNLMPTDARGRHLELLGEAPIWPLADRLYFGSRGNCRFDPPDATGHPTGIHTMMHYAARVS